MPFVVTRQRGRAAVDAAVPERISLIPWGKKSKAPSWRVVRKRRHFYCSMLYDCLPSRKTKREYNTEKTKMEMEMEAVCVCALEVEPFQNSFSPSGTKRSPGLWRLGYSTFAHHQLVG